MDNIKNNNEKKAFNKPRSINLVLLAISLIIFGSLGLMIITQMELLQGWTWQEFSDDYPIDSRAIESGDINNDGIDDYLIGAPFDSTETGKVYLFYEIRQLPVLNGMPAWITPQPVII
ncbi:MAG: integrin alpha [Candidatus Lokiarchaeota archaeon]